MNILYATTATTFFYCFQESPNEPSSELNQLYHVKSPRASLSSSQSIQRKFKTDLVYTLPFYSVTIKNSIKRPHSTKSYNDWRGRLSNTKNIIESKKLVVFF